MSIIDAPRPVGKTAPDATIADVRRAVEPCELPWQDAGDPDSWPAWTGEAGATAPTIADMVEAGALPIYTLGPDDIEDAPTPRHVGPTVDLAGWVEIQVRRYQALGTEAGDMVADHLSDLLAEVAILDARTPDAVYDRRAAMAGRAFDLAG